MGAKVFFDKLDLSGILISVRETHHKTQLACYVVAVECWAKPPIGMVKCNVDVSFSMVENKVDTGICLRDALCSFIGAQTH